ncbi:hypothetical protein JRO89_XS08G0023100 [Xanthoceras sorbifolium]|uniref:Cytochrome P450 n=1 Tax=Xanthoceras sorbifolium TaxID=99658 RepID=A0ABQ8HNJ4_9ROSI|nr:hypothetical protein JRO89_XS08G0023100 [Xanthoceras sorbifolium]
MDPMQQSSTQQSLSVPTAPSRDSPNSDISSDSSIQNVDVSSLQQTDVGSAQQVIHLQIQITEAKEANNKSTEVNTKYTLQIQITEANKKPPLEASKYMAYNQKNLVMAPYGSYWRNVRKMCTLELLSNHKINSFKSMRKEEVDILIEYVKEAACSGIAVDLSAKVGALNADMTCRMVFGKKYMEKEFDERGFKDVMEEVMELLATINLADYIPQIASLDLQGLRKRMKVVSKVFDEFLEKIIDEHVHSKDDSITKDFVDLMLSFMGSEETEYRINREHIKAIISDMFGAAMDTSASSIEWVLSEQMNKLQNELENVLCKDRKVEESDLDNLEYLDILDIVAKET